MFGMIEPRNFLEFQMELEGYADAPALTTGSEWDEEISDAIGSGSTLRKRRSPNLTDAQIEKLFGGLLDAAGPHREQLRKNYCQMFGKV